jgi:hypothetical protein
MRPVAQPQVVSVFFGRHGTCGAAQHQQCHEQGQVILHSVSIIVIELIPQSFLLRQYYSLQKRRIYLAVALFPQAS